MLKDCRSLKEAGLDPVVICWARRLHGVPVEDRLPGDVPLLRIFQKISGVETSLLSRYLTFRKLQAKIVRAAVSMKPEIIHCYDLEMLEAGARIKRQTGAILCYVALEHWPLMERSKSRRLFVASSILERVLIRSVDQVITVNDFLVDRYLKYCPTIRVMNCAPVNWNKKIAINKMKRIRERLGLADSFVVTHHGALNDFKGMSKLLDVAILLKKKGAGSYKVRGEKKKIKFVVLGSCPEKKRYLRVIRENGLENSFMILNSVPFDSIPDFLSISHVNSAMLKPAHMNLIATPVKTLEAMNCSVPVQVNSECPMIADIVDEEKCGITCRYDTGAMLNSLLWMMDHPLELERMGRSGRKAVERKYNWEKEAKKMISLYTKLLENRG